MNKNRLCKYGRRNCLLNLDQFQITLYLRFYRTDYWFYRQVLMKLREWGNKPMVGAKSSKTQENSNSSKTVIRMALAGTSQTEHSLSGFNLSALFHIIHRDYNDLHAFILFWLPTFFKLLPHQKHKKKV